MGRTGIRSRALRSLRRMRFGAGDTVYLLGPALTSLASTTSVLIAPVDDGRLEVRLSETATVTAAVLQRTHALAIASGTGLTTYLQWRKVGDAAEVVAGQAWREWTMLVAPTGNVFTPAGGLLLETGDDLLLETGDRLLMEAA